MNRDSISPQRPHPASAQDVTRATSAREAGLELIRRINRWLVAGAVAAVGLFSLMAAHAFHGRNVTTGRPLASSSATSRSGSSSDPRSGTVTSEVASLPGDETEGGG